MGRAAGPGPVAAGLTRSGWADSEMSVSRRERTLKTIATALVLLGAFEVKDQIASCGRALNAACGVAEQ